MDAPVREVRLDPIDIFVAGKAAVRQAHHSSQVPDRVYSVREGREFPVLPVKDTIVKVLYVHRLGDVLVWLSVVAVYMFLG